MKRTKPGTVRRPRIAIRQARMSDVEPIHALITEFSRQERMLARSRAELYELLRDFLVAEHRSKVIGCGALSIEWEGLAEIKSLAVARAYQKRGLGRRLVQACLAEARRLGIGRIFALTSAPAFFEHLGFERVDRESLPHKVWSDCIKCPKFPDCDELAVAIELPKRSRRPSGK
ncbi:MAG TPA: N-acetyltransferase [Phycisphaerae bacterium]|nr:N-acetyltransferase [Phycisphaerae bacterium]